MTRSPNGLRQRRRLRRPHLDDESLSELGQGLLNARQLGRMARIEQATDFFLVAPQPCRQLRACDPSPAQGNIQGRLGGHGCRHVNHAARRTPPRWGRDEFAATNTAGNGLFQAVGRLRHGVGLVPALGERFGKVREANQGDA